MKCPREGNSCSSELRRQHFVEREPPFLVLVLQRSFATYRCVDGVRQLEQHVKVNTAVEFPPVLDFMRSGTYDFKGVVHHQGSGVGGGRYVATCSLGLGPRDEEVFGVFSDNAPVKCKPWAYLETDAVQREAYMLLYARREYAEPRPAYAV